MGIMVYSNSILDLSCAILSTLNPGLACTVVTCGMAQERVCVEYDKNGVFGIF